MSVTHAAPAIYAFPFGLDNFEESKITEVPLPRRRTRTLSLISVSSTNSSKIAFDLPKATATIVLTILPKKYDAFGSFTPTSSACASLRSLADSDISCLPPTIARDYQQRRRRPRPIWTVGYDVFSQSSSTQNSPLSSPVSPSVPAISRTSSPFSTTEFHSQPPLTFPSPSRTRFGGFSSQDEGRSQNELNPILASLERKSKLCTRKVYCATCKKPGTNFPKCPRCGEVWCSRDCRLHGGRKHVCAKTPRDR